jgi:hypothetical protein
VISWVLGVGYRPVLMIREVISYLLLVIGNSELLPMIENPSLQEGELL